LRQHSTHKKGTIKKGIKGVFFIVQIINRPTSIDQLANYPQKKRCHVGIFFYKNRLTISDYGFTTTGTVCMSTGTVVVVEAIAVLSSTGCTVTD
jgi:hypothetical protein